MTMTVGSFVTSSFTVVYVIGWTLLTHTSARLLFPDSGAAWDRLTYALDISKRISSLDEFRLKLRILCHILVTYLIILPLIASYLWTIDELFFGNYYTHVQISKPIITISVPRAGTTSFHRTLALDERFVTPVMLELVMPFLCLHKLIYAVQHAFPRKVQQLESFLKWINGVTPEVEARHPISLFSPDADDILLGEWHWVSVGSVRTFPVSPKLWKKHYLMNDVSTRKRSMEFHRRLCQKILYNRGSSSSSTTTTTTSSRLLLRSHLSPCVDNFRELYPDAVIVGILRNPTDVLRSFAGLSTMAVSAATGVNMLAATNNNNNKNDTTTTTTTESTMIWPQAFVDILSDMMRREVEIIHDNAKQQPQKSTNNNSNDAAADAVDDNMDTVSTPTTTTTLLSDCRFHHVSFSTFKADPLQTIRRLYETIDNNMEMTKQFEVAIGNGLSHHESYKTRHSYLNPTLEEMGIHDPNSFSNLQSVQRYQQILEELQ